MCARTAHRGHTRRSGIDCAHAPSLRILNHEEEASQDDSEENTDNKVPERHADHDGDNRDILGSEQYK